MNAHVFIVERGKNILTSLRIHTQINQLSQQSQETYHCSLSNRDYLISFAISFLLVHSTRLSVLINQIEK